MEKILNNKYIKIILNIVLVISMISFSFIFSVSTFNEFHKYELVSMFLSFILGLYLIYKQFIIQNLSDSTRLEKLVALIFSIMLINEMRIYFDINNSSIISLVNNYYILKVIKISTKILSLFFIYLMFLYLVRTIGRIIIKLIKSIDSEEKIFINKYLLMLMLLITLTYTYKPTMYYSFDKVFSMDTSYIVVTMFRNIFWSIDIRHILLSDVMIPANLLALNISNIFNVSNALYPILIAFFNLFLLVLISIMLKRITNNKWVMYLFLLSYPSILYSLFIEKYVICIFFIVLFFYARLEKDEKVEDLSLIASIGTISTNVLLGFFSGKGKIKDRLVHWIKLAIIFICVCALFGKIGLLLEFYKQSSSLLSNINPSTILERINGLSELFYSILFLSNWQVVSGRILWVNTATTFNYIGLIIFIIAVFGFIRNYKNYFLRVCTCWMCVSFVLFIGFNWYVFEAPLFSLYFSWAVIPLIVSFIDNLKIIKKDYIYYGLAILMLMVNVIGLLKIITII